MAFLRVRNMSQNLVALNNTGHGEILLLWFTIDRCLHDGKSHRDANRRKWLEKQLELEIDFATVSAMIPSAGMREAHA